MATKNRFAISTVFDFDDRPFNNGVDSVTYKTEKLASNSKHQYLKMFRDANTTAKKTEKSYTDMFRGIAGAAGKFKGHMAGILGGAGVGSLLAGMTAQSVLEDKYKAEAVGLIPSDLKSFSLIAKQADLQVDNVADLFEEMHNKLGMAKKGIYEAGLKDYGQTTNLTPTGLSELLNKDVLSQFETIISELDKMDLQAAIGIGDSLFGGEFNRFYRSYRSHYKDLADARKAWGAVNNLTDEGRKGNEEYAASLNVLKESLFSALQDVSGHVGHELTPFVDSFNSAFNSIYRDSDQWLDEILSNFDVHLDDSYKNVAKWGAGIVGVLGGIFASYKVSGKILSGTKSVLQKAGIASPDVQKVFVVNMPASGLGGIDPSDGGSGGKGKGPRIPSSTTKTRALSSVLLRGVALEWGPAILKGGGALTLLASAKEYQPRNWNPNPGAAKTFYDNTLKEEKKSSLDIMNSEKAKDSLSVMYRNNDVVPIVPTVINNNGRDSEQLDKVNRSLERLIDLQEQSSTSNESSNSGLDHVSVMSTDGFNH